MKMPRQRVNAPGPTPKEAPSMQEQGTKRVRVKSDPGIYYREGRNGKRRYQFQYRDSNGRQRWKTVEGGLEAARDARNETRRKLRQGEIVRPVAKSSRAKFQGVAQEWLVARRPKWAERTHEDYKLKIDRVDPYIGDRWIDSLSEDDVAELVASLHERYARDTVKNTLTPVSGVFKYAIKNGLAARNPVALLDKDDRPQKGNEREKRILSKGEIEALLGATTYGPVMATAVFTGLRQMEVLGLRWGEIDFEKGYVLVREQLSRSGGRAPLKTPKAKRDVVLMPGLAKMLREHRARSPFSADDDYVFTTGSGKPYGWSNVDRELKSACDRAKLAEPKPRFHDLRHTFASLLIAQGANVVYVSGQLGHASSDITLRVYAHLFASAEHGDKTRALLEAEFGNSVVTGASRTVKKQTEAQVLDLAEAAANRTKVRLGKEA
jgi:integrase